MTKLNELTIAGAARGLRAKEFTVRELWNACAAAAKERNGELNAYLELFDADDAAIDAAQKRIDAGDASQLCGIPLAIKDNILIDGHTEAERCGRAVCRPHEHGRVRNGLVDRTFRIRSREESA